MRLLLDTNILVPLIENDGEDLPAQMITAIRSPEATLYASVTSIWEVAIKHRLGKLRLPCPLKEWPVALESSNVVSLDVITPHVIQAVEPPVDTRDPFDRLLIAICITEQLELVTTDAKLRDHPLAWKAPAA